MSDIKAPKGTRDIFAPEIHKWQYLESAIRAYYGKFLYQEIRTPVFEHSELFSRGIGSETEVVQKEMYTFKDKADRSLTLRPENTASVVRAAIENNLFETMAPLRF
jgi:histidyl-tRNA synthetase